VYKLILADPPWLFRNWSADAPKMIHNRARGANRHYPTENVENICNLVPPSDDDAILLIWGLSSHVPELLKVIDAWGFTLKTKAWTLVKTTKTGKPMIGMGYWTRQCTEDCWLATKGKPKRPEYKAEPGIIIAPRIPPHSKKPEEQYKKIDRLFPNMYPRLEMFARETYPGWDVFGNEIMNSIEIPYEEVR
jgi:N6-adenosine-specific RNA methylase IME4